MRRLGWLAISSVLIACTTDTFVGTDAAVTPVTFRAKSVTADAATTTITFNRPTAAAVGDLLIAFVVTTPTSKAVPPLGWTEVGTDTNTGCSTASYKAIVFKGEVKATDAADYAVQMTESAKHFGALLVYANGSTAKVELVQSSSITSNSTFNLDAIPTIVPGAAVVAAGVAIKAMTGWPKGMTERTSFGGGFGSLYDASFPTGGSLPQRTFETTDPVCGSVFQLVLAPR